MVIGFSNRAKQILQTVWSEPRDRALHLLLVFFGAAAILMLVQRFDLFSAPAGVRMFFLQSVLVVLLIYLALKGWRPILRTERNWFLGIIALYLTGLFLLDRLAALDIEVAYRPLELPAWDQLLLGLVLAPILEELFFRDYLFRVLSSQGMKWSFALLLSAAFFTLAHFSLYPGAFFLGLLNGILYIASGGVLLPIAFHLVCNLSWYLLPAFYPSLFYLLEHSNLREIFYR